MLEFLAVSNDFLLALGAVTGLLTKMYALKDESTIWSRKSSGSNLILYPFTALYPFYDEGLYLTFLGTLLTFMIWVGIFVWRAPAEEDWLGRVEMTYAEWFISTVEKYL